DARDVRRQTITAVRTRCLEASLQGARCFRRRVLADSAAGCSPTPQGPGSYDPKPREAVTRIPAVFRSLAHRPSGCAGDLHVIDAGTPRAFPETVAGVRDFKHRDQIRGSSASAPSNIAEGFGRFSPAEFALFLKYARASLME